MVKALCRGKLQHIKISLQAEISLRRAVSGHEDFHAENFMGLIFSPMNASTPGWVFAHPWPGGTLSKSIIPQLCPTLDTSAGKFSLSCSCQEASVAAVTLSEGSSKGFPHTRES